MRIAGLLVATALVTAIGAAPARADNKAWTAAKAALPADTSLVVAIDLATVRKSQLFQTWYPKLLAKQDAAASIAAMKAACNVEPVQALQGAVMALGPDGDDGVFFLALGNIDRAKLSGCLGAAVANNDKSVKISVKNDGNITEVTKDGVTNYFGWIGKDVVVLPKKAGDKASIARWTGGKGAFAKSDAAKLVAKTSTAATIWFAGAKPPGADLGAEFKTGYGAIKYAGAMYDVDIHGQMPSADASAKFTAQTQAQLGQAKQFAAVSPALNNVLNAIVVTSVDADVVVKAKLGESDLITALAMVAP